MRDCKTLYQEGVAGRHALEVLAEANSKQLSSRYVSIEHASSRVRTDIGSFFKVIETT